MRAGDGCELGAGALAGSDVRSESSGGAVLEYVI